MNGTFWRFCRCEGDPDFNPDKMWYMFEYFIGGAGKFVERTGSTAMKLKAKAEDNDIRIEANDIPFMRILYGEPSKYMDRRITAAVVKRSCSSPRS